MACTDCFNGCSNTTPDKCVKYTGVDHPELDIEKGNSLLTVEENIILKILSMSIGEGILPTIDNNIICTQLQNNLPLVGPYTLNNYLEALIKTACENGVSIDNLINSIITINNTLSDLNSSYTIPPSCIDVLPQDDANTHLVLQKVIDFLCTLNANLPATYVALADLNNLISDYITNTAPANLVSNKMIPYVAMPLFQLTPGAFDITGSGIGSWNRVFLCNGAHGTPDLRGMTIVGVTNVLGGGAYNPKVDPSITGNPDHVLNTPNGQNTVTLNASQMPVHTHISTIVVTDPGHTHQYSTRINNNYAQFSNDEREVTTFGLSNLQTGSSLTGITVTSTNSNEGGGQYHNNIQPVLPAYYIMYVPL